MFINYRRLNVHTISDVYHFPIINHILDRSCQARFTTFTVFAAPETSLLRWRVMQFGLHSTSSNLQRAFDIINKQYWPSPPENGSRLCVPRPPRNLSCSPTISRRKDIWATGRTTRTIFSGHLTYTTAKSAAGMSRCTHGWTPRREEVRV